MIINKYLALFFTVALAACGNVHGGSGVPTTKVENSLRSMRLGAVTRADSAVALSVAIDTREVITVLNRSTAANAINQVLYQSKDQHLVSIAVEQDGTPVQANADGSSVVFSRISNNLIGVQATINGTAYQQITASIPPQALQLLQNPKSLRSSSLQKDTQSSREALLARAIIGVRIFGCSAQDAFNRLGINTSIVDLAAQSCDSLILDSAQQILDDGSLDEIPVDEITYSDACESAAAGDLSAASTCVDVTGEDLVKNVLETAPDLDAAVTGETDPDAEISGDGDAVDTGDEDNDGDGDIDQDEDSDQTDDGSNDEGSDIDDGSDGSVDDGGGDGTDDGSGDGTDNGNGNGTDDGSGDGTDNGNNNGTDDGNVTPPPLPTPEPPGNPDTIDPNDPTDDVSDGQNTPPINSSRNKAPHKRGVYIRN